MKTIILISLISLFPFFGNEIKIIDYRDQYIGHYKCSRTYKHLNSSYTTVVVDRDTCSIFIQKYVLDSVIVLKTMEGEFKVKVKNNQFTSTKNGQRFYGNFFDSDSLILNFIPSNGPNAFLYRGEKN